MGLIKRINIVLSITILVVCAGAFLLFGWSGSGWKALAIPTGSMRPDIPPGSLVLVHSVPLSSLKVGDVITHIDMSNPKITISHRIIKAYRLDGKIPAFVTKGDANKIADVPIVGGEVIGKVVWHVPYAGWALLDAKKPIVILPIIYIAALLIIIEEVQRLSEYYRRFVLYRVPGFRHDPERERVAAKRVRLGATLTAVFILIGAAAGPTALAALHSNTVSLVNNKISVASSGSGECSGNNSNNVNVNNSTTQTSTTGSTTGTGNNAAGGTSTNNSSSNVHVTVGC
jgi:signal peptidase I